MFLASELLDIQPFVKHREPHLTLKLSVMCFHQHNLLTVNDKEGNI